MFGIVSVILATLVSFAYLMPEDSTASETALVPAVTIVTSTSATTTVTTSTSTTLTTSATTTVTSATATSTSTTTSLTSTTTRPETVSTVTQTTPETETTTVSVSEAFYVAENYAEITETVAGEADESSTVVYPEDENSEDSDKRYSDENETSGERVYLGTFKITHYCACSQCCGESTGLTASGTYATAGRTVGASGSFDFGTQLEIDGHVYVVEDRGGFSENTIDIFCDSHEEALEKGSYYTDVYIVE